ncbi:hypothetical protein HKD37_05G013172 [Glycine soja]
MNSLSEADWLSEPHPLSKAASSLSGCKTLEEDKSKISTLSVQSARPARTFETDWLSEPHRLSEADWLSEPHRLSEAASSLSRCKTLEEDKSEISALNVQPAHPARMLSLLALSTPKLA